jgi:hypothetical protein
MDELVERVFRTGTGLGAYEGDGHASTPVYAMLQASETSYNNSSLRPHKFLDIFRGSLFNLLPT